MSTAYNFDFLNLLYDFCLRSLSEKLFVCFTEHRTYERFNSFIVGILDNDCKSSYNIVKERFRTVKLNDSPQCYIVGFKFITNNENLLKDLRKYFKTEQNGTQEYSFPAD